MQGPELPLHKLTGKPLQLTGHVMVNLGEDTMIIGGAHD